MTVSRRDLLEVMAGLGIGNAAFRKSIAVAAEGRSEGEVITAEMVANAEWVAGITLTDDERRIVATSMTFARKNIAALQKVAIGYAIPPAVQFDPVPGEHPSREGRGTVEPLKPAGPVARPAGDADLAFLSIGKLAELIRTRKISSTELTKIYLARLKKYDPALHCVVSLTEELALQQARQADQDNAAGKYRGPLHGIPWVAKDLIAYPGYRTTWGAGHFKDQVIDQRATVASRLDAAGTVLVAKSTLGALAWGDRWFGGLTRNPWDVTRGSSGSSAGTASAVAAGLCAFGLGSETLGSIVSPSTECGVTGLRPTFGRVSRHGCMPLAWTLDKVGPMARCVEDCALVLGAIHGHDGLDPTAIDRPFHWPARRPVKQLRVGHLVMKDEPALPPADMEVLEGLGVQLVPITLPLDMAENIIRTILDAEAATVFDDITRAGVKDDIGLWPATFRRGRFVTAVVYLRAQRARTLLMREMARVFEKVDAYACTQGTDLAVANLTGHPTLCLPNGFTRGGRPTALTFTGKLFGETELLSLAKSYQDETGHHLKRPPEGTWVIEEKKKDK
jgi:Asp-tRNA(Asn)/Glu-tRNA(Gln) amidotransferase A subunit family amidase